MVTTNCIVVGDVISKRSKSAFLSPYGSMPTGPVIPEMEFSLIINTNNNQQTIAVGRFIKVLLGFTIYNLFCLIHSRICILGPVIVKQCEQFVTQGSNSLP